MSSPENGAGLQAVLDELRTTAPAAPPHLRARVEAMAGAARVDRVSLLDRLSLRRAVLVLAPATLAVALGAAVIGGLSGASSDPANEAGPAQAPTRQDARGEATFGPVTGAVDEQAALDKSARAANSGLPPARRRAQDYRAALRLRVDGLDDLSQRTKEAIRATRAWGGYVVSVDYDIPGEQGDARLELRVPVQHVQAAVQRFSELGTILAQDIAIRDVQGRLDRYTRDVLTLRERMAKLRADLRQPGLSDDERARLERRLARARRAVAERTAERTALARRASFATVSLTLTTRKTAAVPADKDGRIERALEDAASVLAKEVAFALYAVIVAAPFLLLAAAAYFATRAGRRRADERLLERA